MNIFFQFSGSARYIRFVFIKTGVFREHGGLLGVFGTNLQETFQKNFSGVEKWVCCPQMAKKGFSRLIRISSGIFGSVELMKFYQKCPFANLKRFKILSGAPTWDIHRLFISVLNFLDPQHCIQFSTYETSNSTHTCVFLCSAIILTVI